MRGLRLSVPDAGQVAAGLAWLVVLVFTVLTVGSSLAGTTTFLGVDLLTTVAPWKSATETASVQVPFLGDTVDSVVPQSMLIVDAARQGNLAEWNPYQHGGAELGGMPNAGVYSPLSLPWWILPHEYAPGAVKLLEIVAVGVGFSLFLRRLRLPGVAWAAATLVFVSSGFMVAWTNWPQTRVAALLPLLFWALDRAAVRARWTDAIPIGLVVASMLLGGFPAVTAYALYAGAAYLVVRAAVHHRAVLAVVRAAAWSLAGVVLGFLLAAWQLVPFALNATSVINFDVREQTPDLHLPWESLATAVVPDIFGAAGSVTQWGGAHPVERLSYVGVAAVVLVAAALAIRPARSNRTGALAFAAASTVVGVVLVYVGGVALGIVQMLPVFSNNPIGRVRVLVGFFVAILVAYGIAAVLAPRGARQDLHDVRREPRVRVVLLVRVVAAAIIGVVVVAVVRSAVLAAPDRVLAGAQVRQAALIGLACLVVVLVSWVVARRRVGAVAAVVAVVLVAAPAASLVRSWWPQVDYDLFYPATETHEFLDENLDGDRYATVGQVMLPGTSSAYRQRSLGGHVFMTEEWREVLLEIDPDSLLTPTYSVLSPQNLASSVRSPLMDRLAVSYVVADPASDVLGTVEPGPEADGSAAADGDGLLSAQYSGPVRGVRVDFPTGIVAGADGARIVAELLDESGAVITETSTWVPGHSGKRMIAIQGDRLSPDTTWRVRLTVTGDGADAEAATVGGALALDVIRPDSDDVVVADTGSATVYERANALPRIRWANSEVVEEDIEARVRLLADPSLGAETVVLEDTGDAYGLPGTSTASLEDISPDDDHVVVSVEADGAGWVVVEDSLRRAGWTATVDGEHADLIAAEHVGGAVYVEEGTHVVELSFSTPGLRTGIWVSLGTVAALLVLGAALLVRARRPRTGTVET